MAKIAHKKTARAATKTPDAALIALVKALARDLAERDFEAESGSDTFQDSAQNSPDQRS